jgi:hypothetical protein
MGNFWVVMKRLQWECFKEVRDKSALHHYDNNCYSGF